jgi:hypothetical protein
LFIFAIEASQKMWPPGDEPAFTLIPNFLLTGISAMIVGLTLILWSLGSVHKKHGATVLILLFVLLLLVGGGVAQILFFPFLWLVATRIHQPLTWWRKFLPAAAQKLLAKLWPASLVISAGLLSFALEIATTGFVPGVNDPETSLAVMLFCLGMEVIMFPLTFIAGFAYDILSQPKASAGEVPG